MTTRKLNPFAAALLPFTLPALAAPSGGQVVAGQAGISTPDPKTTVIDQTSQGAVINWQNFSVGHDEFVLFNQPNASAAILNRVIGGAPSEILGSIRSNGRVFLVNPSGVLFGNTAKVDVGSLMATTLDISNSDFMAGRYKFAGNSAAEVRNDGSITAADSGYVVLGGNRVTNTGLIQAKLGDVVLAGASALTLSLDDAGLVSYAIDAAALSPDAGVNNLGEIAAQGGRVVLDARLAQRLAATAVNNSGRIDASGIAEQDGEIYLTARGGDIAQSGMLDASGVGGTVKLSSDGDITLASGSQIDATGGNGEVRAIADGKLDYQRGASLDVSGGQGFVELSGHRDIRINDIVQLGEHGTLVIDPTDFVIGANGNITEQQLEAQLRATAETSQVQIVATNSITVQTLSDGLIDGHTDAVGRSGEALGGGLLLGIGTLDGDFYRGSAGSIRFSSPAADGIRVDGNLDLYAGSSSGDIVAGALQGHEVRADAGGNVTLGGALIAQSLVSLDAGNTLTTQAITGQSVQLYSNNNLRSGAIGASEYVYIYSRAGSVLTGDVTVGSANAAPSDASLNINAEGGSLQTGRLSLIGRSSTDLSLYAAGDLLVGGDISLDTLGGGTQVYDGAHAYANLQADGALTLTGNVRITSQAADYNSGYGGSGRYGDTALYLSAARIAITGGVDLSGVGNATVDAYAEQSIRIDGNVSASSTAAEYRYTYSDSSSLSQGGLASIYLQTPTDAASTSSIQTGDLRVSGPMARVVAGAAQLRIGDANASTAAVQVNALPGGRDSGGVYSLETYEGETESESTAGAAYVLLVGSSTSTQTPAIQTTGGLSVTGPTVSASLLSGGGIDIGGDITLRGTGYRASGTFDSGQGLRAGGSDFGFAYTPELSEGELFWGAAGLSMAGYRETNGGEGGSFGYTDYVPAGAVRIRGDVVVSGIGSASASIYAQSLNAGAISVDAQRLGAGTVLGDYLSYDYVNNEFITRTTSYDDGNGGAARYGEAVLDIELTGTAASQTGNLNISGLSARAGIIGAGNLSTGAISLTGASTNLPVWRVRHTAEDSEGEPFGTATSTTMTGAPTRLAISVNGDLVTGNIAASGNLFTTASLKGNTVRTGDIVMSNVAGRFGSNDVATYGQNYADTAYNALSLQLITTANGAPRANTGRIALNGADTVYLGGAINATSVSISAGTISQQRPNIVNALDHPLASNSGLGSAEALPQTIDLLASGDIALTLSQGATLSSFKAQAGGLLSLDANDQIVRLPGALDLSGARLRISNTRFDTQTLSLAGTGADVEGSAAVQLLDVDIASPYTLTSAAGLLLDDSSIVNATPAITAGGALRIVNGSRIGGAQGAANSLTLSGGSITVDASSLDATQLSLTAPGAVTLSGSTLKGGLTLTGGSVALSNSQLSGSTAALTAGTTLSFSGGAAAYTGNVSLTAGTVLSLANLSFNSVNQTTLGTVTLSSVGLNLSNASLAGSAVAISSTTGATTLTGSTLTSRNALTLAGASITSTGSTLDATRLDLTSPGALTIGGNSALRGLLTVTAGTVSVSSSQLSGSLASLSTGTTLTLGSGAALTYTGNISLTAGTALSLSGAAINNPNASTRGSVTLSAGASISLSDTSLLGTAITLHSGTGATGITGSTLTSSSTLAINSGALTSSGSTLDATRLDLTSTGAVTLSNNSTLRGLLTLTADSLAVSSSQLSGSTASLSTATAQTLGNGSSLIYSGNISLSAGTALSLASASINSPNTTTRGSVTLSATSISLSNTSVLGTGIALNSGTGATGLTGSSLRASNGLTISGGSITTSASTLEATQLGLTSPGAVTVSSNSVLTGALTANTGSLNITGSQLSGSTAVLNASGVMGLGGSLTYTGNIAATAGGVLNLTNLTINSADQNSLGTVSLRGVGANLSNAKATAQALTLDAGSGAVSIGNNSLLISRSGLTVTGSSIATDFSTLDGAQLALTSTGAVSLVNTTLKGALTANAGSLNINNSLLSGSTATLNATGAISLSSGGSAYTGDVAVNAGGALSITGTSLNTLSQNTLGSVALTGNGITITNASVAAQALTLNGGSGETNISNGLLSSRTTLTGSGASLQLSATSLIAPTTTLTYTGSVQLGGSTLTGNSETLTGELAINAGGRLTISGSDLLGTNAVISSNSDVLINALAGRRSLLRYTGELRLASTGGALNLIGSDIAPGRRVGSQSAGTITAKAAGGGNVVLSAASTVQLSDAVLQGNAVAITSGASILLNDSIVSGGAVRLRAVGGDVADNGHYNLIDATGLGIEALNDIDLAASRIVVGTGGSGTVMDEGLFAQLTTLGLAPSSAEANASFIAQRSVSWGELALVGDHLYVRSNQVLPGTITSAPADLLIQLQPYDNLSVGIEAAAAALRDYNLTLDGPPGNLASPTLVVGGVGFSGNVWVGETGRVPALDETNVVIVTTGEVHRPSRLQTNGRVVVLGGTVFEDSVAASQIIGAVQDQAMERPLPEVSRSFFDEQQDRIAFITRASGALRCAE